MKKLNLMLHAGANLVERNEIIAAPTPAATDTWHPIPHISLIDMVGERLRSQGMEVVQEAHGMYKDGKRYFGMLQVNPATAQIGGDGASLPDDYGLVIGLRNSNDKSFPAGLCMGSGVFVCDNLCFSAEIVIGRRHTKNIMRDLPNLVTAAVGKLTQARIDQSRRLEAYKETDITDVQAQSLIIDALRCGAINTTRVPKVVEQWDKPKHAEFGEKRNVWRLFNGVTEVLKETSLMALPTRTTALHGILDPACGLVTDVKLDLQTAFAGNAEVTVA